MYAKYITNTTSTVVDILEDIKKLITGTVDVNLLSASCDKTNTEIHTSVNLAGWELWDDAAGTNIKVFRSPVYDNPSQYKYLKIDLSTAGYIACSTSDGWNATTHVAVNPMSANNTYGQRFSTAAPNTFYIHSSNRMFFILSSYLSVVGTGSNRSWFLSEYVRWSPWDTSSGGYLNVCANNYNGIAQYPASGRYKDSNAADQNTNWNSGSGLTTPYGASLGFVVNATNTRSMMLSPLFYNVASSGHLGGNITEASGIYGCTPITGSYGDEITLGGTTYIYYGGSQSITSQTNISTLFPKG